MPIVRTLVVFVCVLLVEEGGAGRRSPTPDGRVSESKTAELIVGQQLRGRGRPLKATGRGGLGPTRWLEHFLAAALTGPIGRLVGHICQSEECTRPS